MRALLRFVRSGWLVGLVGLALFALLVWYAAPLLSFADWHPWASEDSRFLTILGAVLAWLALRLIRYLRAQRVSSRLVQAILGRTQDGSRDDLTGPADDEVAVLEEHLQRAVDVLRQGRRNRLPGRQFIYQLPWYVLIGPPGSGKTTALISSQLQFLVTDQDGRGRELRGVHGTRDCDWFFTDQAVLLDTAGRYVTQDSREEVDRGAWLGFLGLLKTYRRRRPINGVIVCVSLPDIVSQSELQAQRESQAIRLRIRELHEQLGIRFPIYLLFTKCDLLAGFSEFYGDLSNDERQQVWGMTFPAATSTLDFGALFSEEFKRLEQRLNERLTSRLEQERDPQRRALIYGFPQQFASVQLAAERFLRDTFEPTRYELPASLRGVYFASGTQVGTPLDRLTASLSSSFGLQRQRLPSFSGVGKSYFISNLLTGVVFPEAGLANSDPAEERRQQWIHRGALAGVVGLSLVVAVVWVNSYFHNRSLIADVAAQAQETARLVDQLGAESTRLNATLPALEAALRLTGGERAGDSLVSAVSQLGLDQRPGLEAESLARYRAVLRDLLLPRIILLLEERLRAAERLDDIYATLRTYLMLRTPDRFDAAEVVEWLRQDLALNQADSVSKPEREALLAHVGNLFERGPVELPLDLDVNLVTQAREKLLGMSLVDRVYAQIIDNPGLWRDLPTFRASDRVGTVFDYVFTTTAREQVAAVDRRFTLDGYVRFRRQIADVTEQLAGESWIVGEGFGGPGGRDLDAVKAGVLGRYLEEYRSRWDAFLKSLTFAPLDNDINKAIDVLQVLSADDSPIKRLLIAVERETTLARADDLLSKGDAAARGALRSIGQTVGGLLRSPSPAEAIAVDDRAQRPVDAYFDPLNDLVRAAEGKTPGINASLGLLTELAAYLKTVQEMRGGTLVDEVKSLSDSVLGRLEQHAVRQPLQLRRWLEVIDWQVRQLFGARALAYLNDEWQATVWRDCDRRLSGRYPIKATGLRDATLEDFGEFFGRGGNIDRFFSEYLEDIVDTSGRVWRVPEDSPLHIGREALLAIQRATVIRDAFFTTQAKSPLVRFSLSPITMDIGINEFALDLDGQTVRFDHSATRAKTLQWPGQDGAGRVSLRVRPPKAQGLSAKTIDGPWAWFRLLDQSVVTRRAADHFDLTFDIDGRKIEYELRASSTINPYRLTELKRFECPKTL